MKQGIHPDYNAIEATCVCGNVIRTGSILPALKMDVCSACHPFFTGVQKLLDAEGRVEQFNKRFAKPITSSKRSKKSSGDAPAAE